MYKCMLYILTFAIIFPVVLASAASEPLMLLCIFFFFTVSCTVSGYLYYNDLFPYLLYLVYIGGLLVLLIYMVAISSNFTPGESTSFFLIWIACGLSTAIMFWVYSLEFFTESLTEYKMLTSMAGNYLSATWLLLLGLLLLYVFANICTILRLGGRTFYIGQKM